ncbi:MAG: ATP-binding protein [Lyngbya sp. HA4199-MV5]|jgi:energy-coupling factor transporter ATP-binding protein EcfA2|nr:ATP-binding protein [Lyngbya sp. HA4199-MV5]
MNQEPLVNQPSQQQSIGNINSQGDDNVINVIQGNDVVVTFNETKIIQISVDEIKTREFKEGSPYKGLRRFESVDKNLFFGRDQFLTGLVDELTKANFILLLGASGSGKSSVVRAGLIPWLSQKRGSTFTDLTFTPNVEPFNSFYQRLHDRYQQADAQFVLEGKADTLTQTMKRLQPPKDFWFIFIDQFEELFTLSQADQRDRFISSLVHMIHTLNHTQNDSVKIVATMRADFLDRLSPYPGLIKATNQHRPMIAEMQLDELRLAIEQPAAHHGVVFETGLVEQIIKDVQGQAGYLPLLQYTLNLLWETEVQTGSIRDRTLNISNYRNLGGVRGALQKHIEEVYQRLSKAEQLAAQRIFLKLIGIGGNVESETEWKPVRRRASRTEFDDPLEQRVAVRLINENLLVSNRETQSQESTVEIAHEVLLTSWTTLSTWIRENRLAIALRNRLNDDVARWQSKKPEDELWGGSKLEQILELRQEPTFNQVLGGFSSAANQFIDASLGLRDRARRRRLGIAMTFPSIIAIAVLIFAVQQQQAQKRLEAVFLDTDTAEILNALPSVLQQARNYRKQVDQLGNIDNNDQAIAYYQSHRSDLNQAFAYYRQILRATGRLQQQVKNNEDFAKTLKEGKTLQSTLQTLNDIWQEAEQSMADMLLKYRIPELKKYLSMQPKPQIGELLQTTKKTDFENQYTKGALRTTYEILMQSSGAGADLNNDGLLRDAQEANQMPCKVLLEIEKLWREGTHRQCGWYGPTSEHEDPNCQFLDPNAPTLTRSTFGAITELVTTRLNTCGITAFKPSQK